MIETNRIVAAIFAAAAMDKDGTRQVADFMAGYEACLKALAERDAAIKLALQAAEGQEAANAWAKLGV